MGNWLLAIAGWGVGLWSATFLHDRAERRRQLAAARMLRAEVRRIHGELGDHPEAVRSSIGAAEMVIPGIHPWVPPLILQVGEVQPAILGYLMNLERHLENIRNLKKGEDRAALALEHTRDSLERETEIVAQFERKADVRRATEAFDAASRIVDTSVRLATQTLRALIEVLNSVERSLVAQSDISARTTWLRLRLWWARQWMKPGVEVTWPR